MCDARCVQPGCVLRVLRGKPNVCQASKQQQTAERVPEVKEEKADVLYIKLIAKLTLGASSAVSASGSLLDRQMAAWVMDENKRNAVPKSKHHEAKKALFLHFMRNIKRNITRR